MVNELKDIVISIVLILLSVLIYVWLIPNYIPENLTTGMSPRFFPTFGTFLIGGFSFILLVISIFKFTKNTKNTKTSSNKKEKMSIKLAPFAVVITLSFFIVIFQWFGFLVASPITIALLMGIFGQRKLTIVLLTSIVMTAVLFFVFNYGLHLPLL